MYDSPVLVPRSPSIAAAVRRYRALAATVLVACVLAAVAVTLLLAPRPVATASLTLDDPRGNSVFRQSNLPPADLASYTAGRARFAHSQPVLARAAADLSGSVSTAYLATHSTAGIVSGTDTLAIAVTAGHKAEAVRLANALAGAYTELSSEQTTATANAALASLDASRRAATAGAGDPTSAAGRAASTTIAALDARAADIRLAAALFDDGVSATEPATAADVASSGSTARNLAAGVLLGILLGVAAAVAAASRKRPVEDPEDAHDALDAPLLGEVSRSRHSATTAQYDVVAATLRAAIPRGTVAVTDCGDRRRPLGAVASVATALATGGARVGLLDAAGGGLADLVRPVDNELRTPDGVVELATADARYPATVRAAIADLHTRCALVVVLCPAVQDAGAAQVLQASDTALLLVPAGELAAKLLRLRHVLALLDVPVLGYVFTRGRIPFSAPAERALEVQP